MSDASALAIIAGQLSLGGAERQLYLWLTHLDRDRFRPIVATLHPGFDDFWEGPVEALGIEVIRIPHRRSRVHRLQGIVAALRRHRPQLVHGWHLFASPYAGAAARILHARASLGSVRGSFRAYRKDVVPAWFTRLLTDGLVVNSETVAAQIRRARGEAAGRIFAVPNAVEPPGGERAERRARFAERWNIPASRFWLLSVGRFQTSKHFDQLIELTAELVREGLDLHLVLIGYGETMDRLKALARARAVESRVTFTGSCGEARLWMEAFDVFCFASTDEGLPNVVMEAAAAGLPVLAWDTDFLRELLRDGTSAILTRPGDLGALRGGLLTLARDEELRRRIGETARQDIQANYGIPTYVRRMTAVYDAVLGSERSPRA